MWCYVVQLSKLSWISSEHQITINHYIWNINRKNCKCLLLNLTSSSNSRPRKGVTEDVVNTTAAMWNRCVAQIVPAAFQRTRPSRSSLSVTSWKLLLSVILPRHQYTAVSARQCGIQLDPVPNSTLSFSICIAEIVRQITLLCIMRYPLQGRT